MNASFAAESRQLMGEDGKVDLVCPHLTPSLALLLSEGGQVIQLYRMGWSGIDLDIHRGDFRMGLPVPQVRPVFSMTERKKLGVERSGGTELRFPVVHVTF